MPAEYVPKRANEVAQGEYYQNHTDYSECIAKHYPAHNFIVVRELLSILFSNRIFILNKPLDFLIVKTLYQLDEFLWGDQLWQSRKAKQLEKLQKLLSFFAIDSISERNDRKHVKYEGWSEK